MNLDVTPLLVSPSVPVVWLLDGLDELRAESRARWYGIIRDLASGPAGRQPSVCIVSCRSALYVGDFGRPATILGLTPKLQVKFVDGLLAKWVERGYPKGAEGADKAWRQRFHSVLQGDNAYRQQATSPLLLRLMVEVALESNTAWLPRSRAPFFEAAFRQLLKNRIGLEPLSGVPARLMRILVQLAHKAELAPVMQESDVDSVLQQFPSAREDGRALLESGLLQPTGPRFSHYEFFHTSFQEWFLAHSLLEEEGLARALEAHWVDPHFEETLSLMWGLASAEERDQATTYLIEQGCQPWTSTDRRMLRGGLQVALHLWGRSGAPLEETSAFRSLLAHLDSDGSAAQSNARRLAVAWDPATPRGVLERLAMDSDPEVRMVVAGNASTPTQALEVLAGDDAAIVRGSIGVNRCSPKHVLQLLAGDEDPEVRRSVAWNESAPPDVLESLLEHGDWQMRDAIAGNTGATSTVLGRLAEDGDERVRDTATANPAMPVAELDRLALSRDPSVRGRVATNPSAPRRLLADLVADEDVGVRQMVGLYASGQDDLLERLSGDHSVHVRSAVATNEAAPVGVLVHLANDEAAEVRISVAANVSSPLGVLNELSRDDDPRIRRWVAHNTSASASSLERLARDDYEEVRCEVAANTAAPAGTLQQLIRGADASMRETIALNLNASGDTLKTLAKDVEPRVRRYVATNPSTPPEVLDVLSEDSSAEVRNGVAMNPNASPTALELLARDSEEGVRRTAANWLLPCLEWL